MCATSPALLASMEAGRIRLLVAAVIDGEVGLEIDGLRRALGVRDLTRLAPHITLVPPTNIAAGTLPAVLDELTAITAAHCPFTIGLGPPGTFAPTRPVVYLAVHEGSDALDALRRSAIIGALAPPAERQERAFVPHVTIATHVPDEEIVATVRAVRHYQRRASIRSITLLLQDPGSSHRWDPIAEFPFDDRVVVGRGGIELELAVGHGLPPDAANWFREQWLAYSRDANGPTWIADRPFAIVARSEGAIAGVATGEIQGNLLVCSRLIVDKTLRNFGIGGQLIRHLERFATERDCTAIRLLTREDGPAQAFYSRRGFVSIASLPDWRDGSNFVVLVRELGRVSSIEG